MLSLSAVQFVVIEIMLSGRNNVIMVQQNPSYTTTLRITLVWSYKRDGRSCGIRLRTETTVRHTKCGRMGGMVVGEGGRSSGVLL